MKKDEMVGNGIMIEDDKFTLFSQKM